MANNKEHVVERYVTPKGELVGFIALNKPSTRFNPDGVYTCSILLSKEDGEFLVERMKKIRAEQFKKYGKGTKVTDVKCVPYGIVNEETGEVTPDAEGRYILTANASAYIKDGKITKHIQMINAKLQPVKALNVGQGTIARLGVNLSGYSVAGKTGVSVKLGMVQIIKLVEYNSGFSTEGFEEEEGFEGLGEEFTEEVVAESEETTEDGETEEDDF